MANGKERASIMEEYYASFGGDDDEDEAEFNPSEDSECNDDFEAEGEDDDDDESGVAVLTGSVSLNDEGRVVYAGTWAMKCDDVGQKAKFKLKSKRIFSAGDGGKNTFDISNPLGGVVNSSSATRRTLLFDGFFVTLDETGSASSSRKIKERDVEVGFAEIDANNQRGAKSMTSQSEHEDQFPSKKIESCNDGCKSVTSKSFSVNGRGCNEFGSFSFTGVYSVAEPTCEQRKNIVLTCEKRYADDHKSLTRSGRRMKQKEDFSNEDDDVISDGDEGANFEELAALHEEAEMSVEELRKRYQGGGGREGGEGGDVGTAVRNGEPPAKKSRKESNSDDDYGF